MYAISGVVTVSIPHSWMTCQSTVVIAPVKRQLFVIYQLMGTILILRWVWGSGILLPRTCMSSVQIQRFQDMLCVWCIRLLLGHPPLSDHSDISQWHLGGGTAMKMPYNYRYLSYGCAWSVMGMPMVDRSRSSVVRGPEGKTRMMTDLSFKSKTWNLVGLDPGKYCTITAETTGIHYVQWQKKWIVCF